MDIIKGHKEEVKQLVEQKTGKKYTDWKSEIIQEAMGAFVQGKSPERREFENKVLNDAVTELMLQEFKAPEENRN